jgi:hypothetical protein
LRVLYHGDEALVDTATFTSDGRAIRNLLPRVGVAALAAEPYMPFQ